MSAISKLLDLTTALPVRLSSRGLAQGETLRFSWMAQTFSSMSAIAASYQARVRFPTAYRGVISLREK